MDKPWPVNIIFAPADRPYAHALRRHLATLLQQRRLTITDRDLVPPGAVLKKALTAQLHAAKIVILLVSVDLINDPFMEEDLPDLLERRLRGEVQVVPLLVRSVFLSGTPLEDLAFLPRSGLPLNALSSQDEALTEVVGHLRELVTTCPSIEEVAAPEPLVPCPVRMLDQGQIFQLWQTLCRLIPSRASIERYAKNLQLGDLPENEPVEVLWKEVLRRLKNVDGDVAPLIAAGQRLAVADPLWPQLIASAQRTRAHSAR